MKNNILNIQFVLVQLAYVEKWKDVGIKNLWAVCEKNRTVVVLCYFFWFWREIVFGVTYVLYNSCVVVSVFCCGGKVNFVRIPYSHDRFSKISRTFVVKKWPHIKPTYEKTNSSLLCIDLQPYSHNCFSKISRTLFDFLNNTYWVFLF